MFLEREDNGVLAYCIEHSVFRRSLLFSLSKYGASMIWRMIYADIIIKDIPSLQNMLGR